jgi:hypothetical protein
VVFCHLEVGWPAFIEEHTCQTAYACIMFQSGDIAERDLLINPLDGSYKWMIQVD